MTVVELVERERSRLRTVDIAATVGIAVVVTLAVIGAGAWLLGESRWIALPRITPLLVWSLLLGGNALVIWWAVRRLREDLARPSVAAAIEREQTLRAGALRGVIEVRDHVNQLAVAVLGGTAVTEKGLVDFFAINGEGLVLCAISSQAPAVFVDVFIVGGLVHVPDAAVPVTFLI